LILKPAAEAQGGVYERYSKRGHRDRERQPVRRLHHAFLAV